MKTTVKIALVINLMISLGAFIGIGWLAGTILLAMSIGFYLMVRKDIQ
mgnify:CR=1 FL=1